MKKIKVVAGGTITALKNAGCEDFDFLSNYNLYNENEIENMKKILKNVYLSFLLSGCTVLSTNTFQFNLNTIKNKNLSIEKGEEIIHEYIDVAVNALNEYKKLYKENELDSLYKLKKEKGLKEYLKDFHEKGKHLNIFSEEMKSIDTNKYLNEINYKKDNKKIKMKKYRNYEINFNSGSYGSSFRDFSEYSGIYCINKENITKKDEKIFKKIINLKMKNTNDIKTHSVISINYYNSELSNLKNYKKYSKNYIMQIKLSGNINFKNSYKLQMLPKNNIMKEQKIFNTSDVINNKKITYKYNDISCINWKLFNYGVEYYIDMTDEEIIADNKFKLRCFSQIYDKVNKFTLNTISNIRELFTFYNSLKYYCTNFNKKVEINFFCNDNKHIGCSKYTLFDTVCILLYLDSYNKFISSIGVNCVNINNVSDLFIPFKKYFCDYNNINLDLYKSENYEYNNITRYILNDLKKNIYVKDINFSCCPNKLLKKFDFHHKTKCAYFYNLDDKKYHIYNYVDEWVDLNITSIGSCCFYTPFDMCMVDYKINI